MQKKIINDFCLTIATINGSGSQTANVTLLRSLFKMGIPVSGKNLFPSNIQGQPTWYTIRVSKDGFAGRREAVQILAALNPSTAVQDLEKLAPGGVLFYADDIAIPLDRGDITLYPMPVRAMSQAAEIPLSSRDYFSNMVYVGVIAQILGIDVSAIKASLEFHFQGKESLLLSNYAIIQDALKWAEKNLQKSDPFYVKPMKKTSGMIMADGNTAAALGAIYGGIQFAAWYPITPASSLAETLNDYLPRLRKKESGATYAVVQAEDELAAIGMTVGAGWSGLRAMTSTSGPGLSLMAEYAGLAYYSETPIVIWDVQRVGPSTGLPTRTAQGDLTETYFLSHGDKQHIILLPGSVSECFEFAWKAFDLADTLQTPVFVLSDLDLGMNQWVTHPFLYPDTQMRRGKILWENDFKENSEWWGRYKDVDGDGITYRTVPGNKLPQAAWFGRGTGHDEYARYTEDPAAWEKTMGRLKNKYQSARKLVPTPEIRKKKGALAGLITYGSSTPAVLEARHIIEAHKGFGVSMLRLRAIPFSKEVVSFLEKHERIYVIENNRDGQLRQIMSMEFPAHALKLRSICHGDGLPLTADWIVDAILEQEQ